MSLSRISRMVTSSTKKFSPHKMIDNIYLRTSRVAELCVSKYQDTECACLLKQSELGGLKFASFRNLNLFYGGSMLKYDLGSRQQFNYFQIEQFSTHGVEKSSVSRNMGRSGFQSSQVLQGGKSQAMLLYLVALVVAMVGCTYAAVPLYRRFCQATGYGGTVQIRETVEEKIARHAQDGTTTSRELVVQFNADVADGMPWKFIPTQKEVKVKPGESALAFYTAENNSSTPITGVSTYNVTPMKAAIYFNKIQCFCFEEQRLLPGEQIDMPVFFYIDPEFETDPKMASVNNLILSYTFFKIGEE